MHFFAYGSLIFAEVMRAVTGRRHESVVATLLGYSRFRVSETSYPGLIESADSSVAGVLYDQVDASSLRLLDRFEGKYYLRRSVTVRTDHGDDQPAETYVIRPEFEHLLTQESWDSEFFRQNHLKSFLQSYQGFGWIESNGSL